MSSAEEGGNQPVHTLLIGGSKHGQYMNFPADQTEWELVESTILTGVGYSPNDDRYVGNIYSRDDRLSRILGVQVFTHAVLAQPEYGGRYPQALRAEIKQREKANEIVKQQDALISEQSELIEQQDALLAEHDAAAAEAKARLGSIRAVLENQSLLLDMAIQYTGFDYRSHHNSADFQAQYDAL